MEGPSKGKLNYNYNLIVNRVDAPAEVGVLWVEGPDPGTAIMYFPASEITETGARLLEEASARRRRQLVERAGGEPPWEVQARQERARRDDEQRAN